MAATPRLGVFRNSMLINPRIIEAPLGKPTLRGFTTPGPDFTYGLRSGDDERGVAEVLSSWSAVSHRGHSAPVLQPVDFVALNRDAVKSGLVTAKELSRYRGQNPPRLQPRLLAAPQRQQSNQPTTAQGGRGFVPEVTFGVVHRLDSPMDLLLASEYRQRWVRNQLKRSEMENRRLSIAWVNRSTVMETRTSLLRKTHSLPPISQTLPRTRRYRKVGPALDTFRDPESRSRALKALERETPSRRGQGRGVYNLD